MMITNQPSAKVFEASRLTGCINSLCETVETRSAGATDQRPALANAGYIFVASRCGLNRLILNTTFTLNLMVKSVGSHLTGYLGHSD